jgi:hypothetical protein
VIRRPSPQLAKLWSQGSSRAEPGVRYALPHRAANRVSDHDLPAVRMVATNQSPTLDEGCRRHAEQLPDAGIVIGSRATRTETWRAEKAVVTGRGAVLVIRQTLTGAQLETPRERIATGRNSWTEVASSGSLASARACRILRTPSEHWQFLEVDRKRSRRGREREERRCGRLAITVGV